MVREERYMKKNNMETAKLAAFETERLRMRLMTKDEWSIFVDRTIQAEEVNDTFACEPDDAFFRFALKTNFNMAINYSVFLADTGEMIGYVGFCIDEDDPNLNNLAYYVFDEYRRQGYCIEAVKAITDMILNGEITEEKPDVIYAWVVWGNKPSSGLLEKAGYKGGDYRILENGFAERCYTYRTVEYEEAAGGESNV